MHNPHVSEEAKERAAERLEGLGGSSSTHTSSHHEGDQGTNRILGGYKATLSVCTPYFVSLYFYQCISIRRMYVPRQRLRSMRARSWKPTVTLWTVPRVYLRPSTRRVCLQATKLRCTVSYLFVMRNSARSD